MGTHRGDLPLPEGNGPGQGREGIGGDIKGEKRKELPGNGIPEVAVHHPGGKARTFLHAPDDTVKFLPRVAVVEAVEVDDIESPVFPDPHIADVIIADNGIGVAAGMAVLADNTLKHGPINCLFTIDEETGLTGAMALDANLLQGDILINLDSEDEGEIFIGCAGGVCNYADFRYIYEPIAGDLFFMKAEISQLTGGHSGDDINKGRANANKLLNRFLCRVAEKYEFYLCDIDGGSLHNAIPRDAWAVFAVQSEDKESVRVDFNVFAAEVQDEYSVTEPDMKFVLQSTEPVNRAIDSKTTKGLLQSIHAVFNGVFAMSQDVPGLVETSSNLASVRRVNNGVITVTTSQRSSIESARDNVSDSVRMAFELAGATVTTKGHYPGWKPNMNSQIMKVACEQYTRLFSGEAKIKAIHAGLECGLFLEKAPHLDMISFGPTMRGVHSPDEKLNIPSTERFWQHLVAILENAPSKQ